MDGPATLIPRCLTSKSCKCLAIKLLPVNVGEPHKGALALSAVQRRVSV